MKIPSFARACAALAILIVPILPAQGQARPAAVDPGILAAARQELSGFSTNHFGEFIGAFTENPILVDDSEPFLMRGRSALREWFRDFWQTASSVSITPGQATDYNVRGRLGYLAFPFSITITGASGSFSAQGVYTATFSRRQGDRWRISSLSIALLSVS